MVISVYFLCMFLDQRFDLLEKLLECSKGSGDRLIHMLSIKIRHLEVHEGSMVLGVRADAKVRF